MLGRGSSAASMAPDGFPTKGLAATGVAKTSKLSMAGAFGSSKAGAGERQGLLLAFEDARKEARFMTYFSASRILFDRLATLLILTYVSVLFTARDVDHVCCTHSSELCTMDPILSQFPCAKGMPRKAVWLTSTFWWTLPLVRVRLGIFWAGGVCSAVQLCAFLCQWLAPKWYVSDARTTVAIAIRLLPRVFEMLSVIYTAPSQPCILDLRYNVVPYGPAFFVMFYSLVFGVPFKYHVPSVTAMIALILPTMVLRHYTMAWMAHLLFFMTVIGVILPGTILYMMERQLRNAFLLRWYDQAEGQDPSDDATIKHSFTGVQKQHRQKEKFTGDKGKLDLSGDGSSKTGGIVDARADPSWWWGEQDIADGQLPPSPGGADGILPFPGLRDCDDCAVVPTINDDDFAVVPTMEGNKSLRQLCRNVDSKRVLKLQNVLACARANCGPFYVSHVHQETISIKLRRGRTKLDEKIFGGALKQPDRTSFHGSAKSILSRIRTAVLSQHSAEGQPVTTIQESYVKGCLQLLLWVNSTGKVSCKMDEQGIVKRAVPEGRLLHQVTKVLLDLCSGDEVEICVMEDTLVVEQRPAEAARLPRQAGAEAESSTPKEQRTRRDTARQDLTHRQAASCVVSRNVSVDGMAMCARRVATGPEQHDSNIQAMLERGGQDEQPSTSSTKVARIDTSMEGSLVSAGDVKDKSQLKKLTPVAGCYAIPACLASDQEATLQLVVMVPKLESSGTAVLARLVAFAGTAVVADRKGLMLQPGVNRVAVGLPAFAYPTIVQLALITSAGDALHVDAAGPGNLEGQAFASASVLVLPSQHAREVCGLFETMILEFTNKGFGIDPSHGAGRRRDSDELRGVRRQDSSSAHAAHMHCWQQHFQPLVRDLGWILLIPQYVSAMQKSRDTAASHTFDILSLPESQVDRDQAQVPGETSTLMSRRHRKPDGGGSRGTAVPSDVRGVPAPESAQVYNTLEEVLEGTQDSSGGAMSVQLGTANAFGKDVVEQLLAFFASQQMWHCMQLLLKEASAGISGVGDGRELLDKSTQGKLSLEVLHALCEESDYGMEVVESGEITAEQDVPAANFTAEVHNPDTNEDVSLAQPDVKAVPAGDGPRGAWWGHAGVLKPSFPVHLSAMSWGGAMLKNVKHEVAVKVVQCRTLIACTASVILVSASTWLTTSGLWRKEPRAKGALAADAGGLGQVPLPEVMASTSLWSGGAHSWAPDQADDASWQPGFLEVLQGFPTLALERNYYEKLFHLSFTSDLIALVVLLIFMSWLHMVHDTRWGSEPSEHYSFALWKVLNLAPYVTIVLCHFKLWHKHVFREPLLVVFAMLQGVLFLSLFVPQVLRPHAIIKRLYVDYYLDIAGVGLVLPLQRKMRFAAHLATGLSECLYVFGLNCLYDTLPKALIRFAVTLAMSWTVGYYVDATSRMKFWQSFVDKRR